MGTLTEHYEAEVEALINKFNDTIMAVVNVVILEFITTEPNISKRCELAITKVKDNKKFTRIRPSPAHISEEPATKRTKTRKTPSERRGQTKIRTYQKQRIGRKIRQRFI